MSFEQCIPWILLVEGGYSNDPNDPGGETKYGISKRAYPNLDIKNLTKEQASQIYLNDYYNRCSINTLPSQLGIAIFDTAVNCGVSGAIKILQRMLNYQKGITLIVDGILGKKTLFALNQYSLGSTVEDYLATRTQYVSDLPNSKFYLRGWSRRMFYLNTYIYTGNLPLHAYPQVD